MENQKQGPSEGVLQEEPKRVLNGETFTESEFLEKKKKLEEQGLQVLEVRPGVFKSRIQG